jgi:hypothetical protein
MFSNLIDVNGAEGALVMNFTGQRFLSQGQVPAPPLPRVDREALEKGVVAVRTKDGRVLAFGQVGANAILVGVFPAKEGVSEAFATAAVQAILLVL